MKLFFNLLKWLGIGLVMYPIMLIYAYFDAAGNIGTWFLLEVLIVDIVTSILLFLFIDFKLVKRIQQRKSYKDS